jgi:shikimate O-hydroxycinnamoyltransferase
MKVEVVETTLVAPSEATPRHALWLSNLDLAVPKTHTPLVYYYPKPAGGEGDGCPFFDPARLREALARALVPFYPLAGRLASGSGGRIEIDCTGEGALFAVARADFSGDEVFQDFEPSPEARRLLVPFAKSGEPPCVLAMVQVRTTPAASPSRRAPSLVLAEPKSPRWSFFLHVFTAVGRPAG